MKVSPRIARQAAGEARWADGYGAFRATSKQLLPKSQPPASGNPPRPSHQTHRTHDVGFFYRRKSGILDRTVGILKVWADPDGRTDVGGLYNRARADLSPESKSLTTLRFSSLAPALHQRYSRGSACPASRGPPNGMGGKACDKYTYGRGWLPRWGLPEEWQQWPHRQTLATRS